MARIPAQLRRIILREQQQAAKPLLSRGHAAPTTPIGAYGNHATVDLGIYGQAAPQTFPASGNLTLTVGPSGVGESWAPDQCYISTSLGAEDGSTCLVYAGPAAIPAYAVTSTPAQGGGAQFGLGGLTLTPGDLVTASWTGGTAGATANLKVTGSRTVLTR
jgi:hypothetical protein